MKALFSMKRARLSGMSVMRGFSLLEISVALVILALLGFSLWKFLPLLNQVSDTEPPEAQLALADEAIIGFIMAKHRLPCPATPGGDGEEQINGTAGCTLINGEFPWRTLALRFATPIHYGVNNNAGLTRLTLVHKPWLPPTNTTDTEWPLEGNAASFTPTNSNPSWPPGAGVSGPDNSFDSQMSDISLYVTLPRQHPTDAEIGAVDDRINGLDFCAKLREVQKNPSDEFKANAIPVAYALAHPGKLDADGDGNAFDGGNNSTAFSAPHQPATADYDDQTLAVGFNELSSRLSCPAYLSRANAAGHTARAAYDNYLFTLAYLQYRSFALDGAYGDLQGAYAGVTLGVVNVLGAIVGTVTGAAVATLTSDEAGVGALASTAIALAEVGVIEGAVELGYAIADLNDAIDGVKEAADARIEAEVQANKIRDVADATALRALALDAKGLRP
ncbi:prepilin-type N-terminal cleavage/methylation domain-containing protein [Betaproteobacteria bacterium]|nr:prepilin-type N-terminal cleavage/methylation domain-containing protein [Betaproteobacteria bacterium]